MNNTNNNNQLVLTYALLGATVTSLYLLWKEQQKNQRQTSLSSSKSAKSAAKSSNKCIYLDYNGTTPTYEFVVHAMLPYFQEHFGNPSSGHWYGQAPRLAVNKARQQVGKLLGIDNASTSIWFTSCGTESDNWAICLAVEATRHRFVEGKNNKPHIVTGNVEHPAIDSCLQQWEDRGDITVTRVPVQPDGRVQAEDVIQAITSNTILVTLMLANNETGALQPVKEVSQHCRTAGIWCHTDAAQAAGKVSVALGQMGDPDLVSLVGHKLGAPKGIACLYVRPGCFASQDKKDAKYILPDDRGLLLVGGGQEFGRRGGTENVPYIVGFGVACERAAHDLHRNAQHMESLRERLLSNLEQALGQDKVRANGPTDPSHRLPNTLSVGLHNIHSGDLLASLSEKVAASAGATCHSTAGVSAVLQAMQVPHAWARGTLRLSVGPRTSTQEIDEASRLLAAAAHAQWNAQPDVVRL